MLKVRKNRGKLHFSFASIAEAKGISVRGVESASRRGLFNKKDLKSISEYINNKL